MKITEIPALLEEDIRRVTFADPGSEITLSTGAAMYVRSVTCSCWDHPGRRRGTGNLW